MKNLFIFALLISTSNLNLSAQNPFDCATALDVCSKDKLEISYTNPIGMIAEGIGQGCTSSIMFLDSETNTIWLKYTFESDGNFTFDIIPQNEDTDIDFVVFKSASNNCEELESIRCMFSGENAGQNNFAACIGSTGLSLNSTDTFEEAGCQDGDDNYLAPLDVAKNDVVYVMISEFNASGNHNYTIEHGGEAELSCTPLSTKVKTVKNQFYTFPNPFTKSITYKRKDANEFIGNIKVFSMSGVELISTQSWSQETIDLEFLNAGIYLIQFTDKTGLINHQKITKL